MSTDGPPGGRRQRKRRDTREALVTAALELFEEQGYVATSIEDITERADVARRTFFRYFASKEAVLVPDRTDYEDRLLAVLEHVEPPLTMGRVLRAFTEAAITIEDDESLQRRRIAIVAENQIQLAMTATTAFVTVRDALIGHIARRTGAPESDPTLHLGVSLGLFAMSHAYVRWATGETEGSLAEELEATVALLRRVVTDEVTLDGASP
jgi:AcrR family transcriptional regulator